MKDIPDDVLQQLNCGEMESANLVEWLAVDQRCLLEHLLKQTKREDYLKPIIDGVNTLKKQTVTTVTEAIGTGLYTQSLHHHDEEILAIISNHTSDMVRCWATHTIGKNSHLAPREKLHQMQHFAADRHFGVREMAWLAVRKTIINHLGESIAILSSWTKNPDATIRRFASEATRPRGVWCEHIDALKQDPSLALPIIMPLKSDESKYVQDSVGNWLNDAGKTQPEFVKKLCAKWKTESQTTATAYIIKKALRTIEKSASKG